MAELEAKEVKKDKVAEPPKSGTMTVASSLSEAQKILETAKEEAKKIKEEAKRQGYEQGLAQGRAEAADAAIRIIQEATQVSEQISEEAAKLALAICSQILSSELETNIEAVKQLAKQALLEANLGEEVSIYVNPEDVKNFEEIKAQLSIIVDKSNLSVIPDSSIKQGGCLVKTEFGEVDARIDTLVSIMGKRLGLDSDEF